MSKLRRQSPLPPSEVLAADPGQLGGIVSPLLAWYRINARALPWRENPAPYRVWVSEIMLQQTRVEAVKGYFTRFMEALPTIGDLAAVPEDRLLKLWEGLGYYNRARNLQRAAQVVCRDHGGKLPASYAQLLELPGVGEYTAGAVGSIAFGIPVPAVDGNVYRVLSRLLGSYADTSLPPVRQAFRQLAGELVPEEFPGDFNQALMELGATVCVPNGPPLCESCPLLPQCRSGRAGKQIAMELPVKAAKKARRIEERTVVFVIAGEKVLLYRRETKGLLPGMFQPINLEGRLSKSEISSQLEAVGAVPGRIVTLRSAKHIFSHVEWHMAGYLVYAGPFDAGGGLWADQADLQDTYALPSAFSAYTKDLPLWLAGNAEQ